MRKDAIFESFLTNRGAKAVFGERSPQQPTVKQLNMLAGQDQDVRKVLDLYANHLPETAFVEPDRLAMMNRSLAKRQGPVGTYVREAGLDVPTSKSDIMNMLKRHPQGQVALDTIAPGSGNIALSEEQLAHIADLTRPGAAIPQKLEALPGSKYTMPKPSSSLGLGQTKPVGGVQQGIESDYAKGLLSRSRLGNIFGPKYKTPTELARGPSMPPSNLPPTKPFVPAMSKAGEDTFVRSFVEKLQSDGFTSEQIKSAAEKVAAVDPIIKEDFEKAGIIGDMLDAYNSFNAKHPLASAGLHLAPVAASLLAGPAAPAALGAVTTGLGALGAAGAVRQGQVGTGAGSLAGGLMAGASKLNPVTRTVGALAAPMIGSAIDQSMGKAAAIDPKVYTQAYAATHSGANSNPHFPLNIPHDAGIGGTAMAHLGQGTHNALYSGGAGLAGLGQGEGLTAGTSRLASKGLLGAAKFLGKYPRATGMGVTGLGLLGGYSLLSSLFGGGKKPEQPAEEVKQAAIPLAGLLGAGAVGLGGLGAYAGYQGLKKIPSVIDYLRGEQDLSENRADVNRRENILEQAAMKQNLLNMHKQENELDTARKARDITNVMAIHQ